MDNKIVIDKSISPSWNILKNIVTTIQKNLSGRNKNLIDTTTLVVHELVENALKYGSTIHGKNSDITFHLEIENDFILIYVSNYAEKIHLDLVASYIDNIKKSDSEELYIGRLNELMHNPTYDNVKLGLYRISYEGMFELDYKIDDCQITITASRKLN